MVVPLIIELLIIYYNLLGTKRSSLRKLGFVVIYTFVIDLLLCIFVLK